MTVALCLLSIMSFAAAATAAPEVAGCGLRFSAEMERFRADLLEMTANGKVECDAYPIKLFPCLFCECQEEWEFVKEVSGDAGAPFYECRWRGLIDEARKTAEGTPRIRQTPPSGIAASLRERYAPRFRNGVLGAVLRDTDTGDSFFAQAPPLLVELDGDDNFAEFTKGIEFTEELSEEGDGYDLEGDASFTAGYGGTVAKEGDIYRVTLEAEALAEADIQIEVGDVADDDD